MIPHIERSVYRYERELKEVEIELKAYPEFNEDYGYPYYKHNSQNAVCLSVRDRNKRIIDTLHRRDSLVLTIKRLRSYVMIKRKIVVEADFDPANKTDGKETTIHENFEDTAGSAVDSAVYGTPQTLSTGQKELLMMSDFLSRPLKLAQAVIPLDTDFAFQLDLWDEFTSHPSVRAKLRNYAYLNATLNVRITLSGTPWHFGKLQVSYQPLANRNTPLLYLESFLGAGGVGPLTYLSQSKGCTVMDVHDNKPLEIECPFISPQPMLRLFNKSPLILAAAGPYADTVGFGKLYINSISPVRAIGTTSTEVGLQVYAWMSNLQLGVPTGTVIEIGTEASLEGKDERVTGPIEAISSKAAGIASALSGIPIIGRFAHASVKPLQMMSKIASLFGFSYPTIITQPNRVKNEPFQNSSQFIGCDTGQRLTIDPKQELSVDPSVTGVSTDDMSYDLLCSTESLLDVFVWSSLDGQLAGSIWMAPVNPNLAKRRLISGVPEVYEIYPTALGFVSTPHLWWRGDITFRFEIVCSQFHRGTLAVIFEPNISQNVVIDTSMDLNKQYIKKIDLQSVTDFEITVKWAYPRPWARVLTDDLLGDLGTVGFLGESLFDYANGYIAVIPYTELQSPDGSDITINVYIRSDNMSFNQFSLLNIPVDRPVVESSYEAKTPNVVDSTDLNETTASEENISCLTFGETPLSFRSALKRFMGWRYNSVNAVTSGTTEAVVSYKTIAMTWPTPSFFTHSEARPNLMGYLRYAYLGMRGGTKHRVILSGPLTARNNDLVVVKFLPPGVTYDNDLVITGNSFNSMSAHDMGSAMYVPATNGGVEFEIPMYTPDLFWVSFSDDFNDAYSTYQSNVTLGYEVDFTVSPMLLTATNPLVVCTSSAAAEDFSFMRYSGAPPYIYSV